MPALWKRSTPIARTCLFLPFINSFLIYFEYLQAFICRKTPPGLFSLYELVLGRDAGETEAGGPELSHTYVQSQGKAAVMEMDVELRCGAAQHSSYCFHLTGVFLPNSVMLNKSFLHFPSL